MLQIKSKRLCKLQQQIEEIPEISQLPSGRYQCKLCCQAFKTSAHVLRHYNSIHQKNKVAKCEICGKEFSRQKNFTTHMMIHKGEKPFNCNFCDWSFRRKDKLKD